MIDEMINIFQQIEITDDFHPLYVYVTGEPIRDLESLGISISSSGVGSSSAMGLGSGLQTMGTIGKRPVTNAANSDDEDSKKSKTMDIYKQRQFKKLIKNS